MRNKFAMQIKNEDFLSKMYVFFFTYVNRVDELRTAAVHKSNVLSSDFMTRKKNSLTFLLLWVGVFAKNI